MKLNQKLIAGLTACLMLGNPALLMPASAAEAVEGTYNGLTYENYENSYIVITDCDTALTAVEIPAEIDGVEVTEIGSFAFSSCYNLTSVTLPETIMGIGTGAFDSCESLTTIQIPARTGVIADDAFEDCDALESITVAAGSAAFKSVDGVLMESDGTTIVRYPSGKADTVYTVPDGVADFRSGAFDDCEYLTEIALPASFASFDSNFRYCDFLQTVTVAEGNPTFKGVDGVLYSKDGSILFCYPPDKQDTAYTIPATTTELGMDAFYGNMNILSVTVPDSLRKIGEAAFYDCMNLQSIALPDSMDSIGSDAFSFCYDLTELKLPSKVNSFGSWMFCYCTSLTSIDLPDNITEIGAGMFQGCSKLTAIEIPTTVSSIGMFAFYDCSGLTDVYFADSETAWNAITIEDENDMLVNATKHFNSSATTPDTPDIPDTPAGTLGDLNADTAIDAADASIVLVAAANLGAEGVSGLTAEQEAAADVNSDGAYDSVDASWILQYATYIGTGGTDTLETFVKTLV